MLRSTTASVLVLAAIASATLLFRLGSLPLIGADEPRYARIAQEMSAAHNWVTPTLEGRPWLEKPPLYYWVTIPMVRLLGPTEAAARLGSALLAFVASLAIFALGRVFWGHAAGLASAAVLLTSIGFVAFGRSASTDMPFTSCLTVSLALLAAVAVGRVRARWTVAAYVFLGLAVLAKGPVALVLAGAVFAAFWCLRPSWRLATVRPWTGAMIVAAVALPWFWLAFRENGFSFIAFFVINHNLARYVSELHHHSEPFYYYAPVLLGLLFPWTGWLAALVPGRNIFLRLKELPRRDPARFFLLLWVIVPVAFFSLSRSKLPGYILPVLPPLALLVGERVTREITEDRRTTWTAWISLGISAVMAIALPLVLVRGYHAGWVGAAFLGAATIVPAVVTFRLMSRAKWVPAVASVVAESVLLVVLLTVVAFPGVAVRHSTRDIAREALSAKSGAEPIVSYKYFHHTLHYYTGYQISDDITDRASLQQFAASYPSILVVTEQPRLTELHEPQTTVSVIGRQGKLVLIRLWSAAARPRP
jgi:4-amino-4-deoxy-L-arabinose transferase-like glycosyltransferase